MAYKVEIREREFYGENNSGIYIKLETRTEAEEFRGILRSKASLEMKRDNYKKALEFLKAAQEIDDNLDEVSEGIEFIDGEDLEA